MLDELHHLRLGRKINLRPLPRLLLVRYCAELGRSAILQHNWTLFLDYLSCIDKSHISLLVLDGVLAASILLNYSGRDGRLF